MKIRAGFVSNSSSSSFHIFGAGFDNDQVRAIAIKLGVIPAEGDETIPRKCRSCGHVTLEDAGFCSKCGRKLEAPPSNADMYEVCELMSEKTDLVFFQEPENGDLVYVGRYWEDIGKDETGDQFRKSVKDGLKKFFDYNDDPENIQEAYYC